MLKKIILLLLLLPYICYANNDVVCKKQNEKELKKRFIDNKNGTIIDKKTNLMWKKCTEGQKYENATCSLNAKRFNWNEVKKQIENINKFSIATKNSFFYANWRLPTIKELLSITSSSCTTPTINSRVFPATMPDFYWSSSTYKKDNEKIYGIIFYYGEKALSKKKFKRYIRFVRTIQK